MIVRKVLGAINRCRDLTVPTTLQIKLNFVIHQGGAQGTHENEITCRPEGKMLHLNNPRQVTLEKPDVPVEDHWFDGLTGVPIVPVNRETPNGSDDTADGEGRALEGSGAGEAV